MTARKDVSKHAKNSLPNVAHLPTVNQRIERLGINKRKGKSKNKFNTLNAILRQFYHSSRQEEHRLPANSKLKTANTRKM